MFEIVRMHFPCNQIALRCKAIWIRLSRQMFNMKMIFESGINKYHFISPKSCNWDEKCHHADLISHPHTNDNPAERSVSLRVNQDMNNGFWSMASNKSERDLCISAAEIVAHMRDDTIMIWPYFQMSTVCYRYSSSDAKQVDFNSTTQMY